MTKETLGKLEYAFSIGATDKEACLYADIHVDSLYEFQKKNPDFSERKASLKLSPVLKARETVFKNLDDPKIAMWFLEKKRPTEYNQRFISAHEEEEEEGPWSQEDLDILNQVFGEGFDPNEDDETEVHLLTKATPIVTAA